MKKLNIIVEKHNWFQILLGIYTALFVFTMMNKEFVLFGFDLRYVLLPLGVSIILLTLLLRKYKVNVEKNDWVGKALLLFYAFAVVANISWLWNGLDVRQPYFRNELILFINIFVSILVFYLNRRQLNFRLINYSAVLSCLVLVFSIIMIHQGYTLVEISGAEGATYSYGSSALVQNINAFGEDSRIAGYASDPNYATILLLIGIVCSLKVFQKNWLRALLLAIFVLTIGLSFSRTVIIALVPCLFYVLLTKKIGLKNSTMILLNRLFIFMIFFGVVAIPYLSNITQGLPVTLTQRFIMWRNAGELFSHSPIVGNGLTSFRSFFLENGGWYVQAHSTIWQVIAEFGIIGIVLYYRVVSRALDSNIKKPLNLFLTMVFVIWITTCETIVLPFSIFVYYIISIEPKDKNVKNNTKKRALFFVNSLKQGGAERVCANMGRELLREGVSVDYILLRGDGAMFSDDDDVDFLDLRINDSAGKLRKIIKVLFSIPRVNLWLRAKMLDNKEYMLVTSHLPASNIITRFSIMGKEALYVFHTRVVVYQVGTKKMYQHLIKWFFRKRRVVTVSKGLMKEYVDEYGGNKEFVKTIYNPVDSTDIAKRAKEKIGISKRKYILQVGRFDEAKNQKRMLEVFSRGEFDKKFDLVFCGSGEGEIEVRKLVENTGMAEHVKFMGYQENVYAWMRRSEVVVSTSDWEAFPMNLVEAFASEAKVVSSDCDFGPREILLGKYAEFLVSPKDDIEQYVEKINKAIKQYPKEDNPILEQCKPSIVLKQYREFYEA